METAVDIPTARTAAVPDSSYAPRVLGMLWNH